MKLSRATIALYVGLVFLSGAALGVFGDQYYKIHSETARNNKGKRPPSPDEYRKMYLSGMQKELLLSEEQVKKLSNIMDETGGLMEDLHKRQQPEQFEIRRAQQEKIRAIFDPIQRDKYDAMLKRMQEFNKNKNKGRMNGGF